MTDREIYEEVRGPLMRFAASLVGPDRASDLVSEVMVATLQQRSLAELENPRAYLMQAVLNRARSMGRALSRERQAMSRSPLDAQASTEPVDLLLNATTSRSGGQWWMAVALVVVIVVGVGLVFVAGRFGGGDASSNGSEDQAGVGDVANSIEGRWLLESWGESEEQILVEVGVNTASEPWIEFTQTFEGARDSFISGDGTGTAGSFVGSTGCNGIRETGYEFSAGFLVLDEAVVQAVGCEPARAEEVLLAMLWNASDGIEVVMDGDRMEWFGSNLEGTVHPLVFHRGASPTS